MPTVLEDYFDFSDPAEIRIRGHRVYFHHVLFEYLNGMSINDLIERFDTLSPDKIVACLLYYYLHQELMDKHLTELRDYFDREEAEARIRQQGLREKLMSRLANRQTV